MGNYSKEIRHFSREDLGNRPIILWGGGQYGEIAYRVITDLWNGEIEAVVDNKFSKVPWYPGDLIRSAKLKEYSHADILICAANAFQTISEEIALLDDDIQAFDLKEILVEYKNYYEKSDTPIQSPYLYGDIDLDEICLRYNYWGGTKTTGILTRFIFLTASFASQPSVLCDVKIVQRLSRAINHRKIIRWNISERILD